MSTTARPRWKVKDETSICLDFEGEYAQVLCVARSSWSYSDGGKTGRLIQATKGIAEKTVRALETFDDARAALEALLDSIPKVGDNERPNHSDAISALRLNAAYLKARAVLAKIPPPQEPGGPA